jgi:hypothetical protein
VFARSRSLVVVQVADPLERARQADLIVVALA